MPTYLDPLNGVSLSEALAEAAAYATITDVILQTLELYHPVMASPIRVVVNTEPVAATLEGSAPRNAGEEVTFRASRVQVEIPEESDKSEAPTLIVHVSNVNRDIKDVLNDIAASDDPAIRDGRWQLIERLYVSSDLTAPHRMPVQKLTAIRVQLQGDSAAFTATYTDSANLAIPAITFTPESYPGLLAL
jgi:hypothetical protein